MCVACFGWFSVRPRDVFLLYPSLIAVYHYPYTASWMLYYNLWAHFSLVAPIGILSLNIILIICKWNLHTTNIKLLLSMLLLLLLLIILFVIAISSRTSSSDDNDGKMCHFLPCLSRLYIMFIISISIKLHRMVELIQLCLFLHCTTMKCSPCRQEKICGSRLI